jgi:hypothetical protein
VSVLHEEFAAWLIEGARDEPARDVAIHASACPSCLLLAGANDALTLIDPSAASMPSTPVGDMADRAAWPLRVTASAAAVFLAAIVGIAASGTLIRQPSAILLGDGSPTPRESVLGDTGSPTPAVTDAPGEDATATADPSPTQIAAPGTVPPPGPPPIGPPPPVGGPTPPAAIPTPTPTPTPTATPSASPSIPISASPSPSPSPSLSPSTIPSPSPSCDVECAP